MKLTTPRQQETNIVECWGQQFILRRINRPIAGVRDRPIHKFVRRASVP